MQNLHNSEGRAGALAGSDHQPPVGKASPLPVAG
jgi:hypothetical protein